MGRKKKTAEDYNREYAGKIYGDIRADEYSHKDENGKVYFWCTCLKCEYKIDKPILLYNLKNGHTKSCGKCATNNPEKYYQEYIGKIYNWVEILKFSHINKSTPYFYCKCLRCGKEFGPVRLNSLKTNKTKSCRHCATNNPEKYYQEYIGKIYDGSIKILKFDHIDKYGRAYFYCKCLRCGEKFGPIYLTSLKNGNTTSCGCRTESKGEEKIRMMLKDLEINFEQYYKGFKDMKDKGVLECDFWLPRFNRVIEFDGELHYQNRGDYGDDLENVQRRDQIKNQYCWDHNIDIVRIPYWEIDNIDYNDLVSKYSRFLVKENECK